MRWTCDRTGRFPERPYYHPDELERECERLITTFLQSRHGRAAFPVATDDLTVLVERLGAGLDLYADLWSGERRVQGFTEFVPGRRPLVRISRRLAEDPRYENRLRTTLTHECGHVWLHGPLWEWRWRLGPLFGGRSRLAYACQQATMVGAPRADWAEWQAGYVSGALLTPKSYLWAVIWDFAALVRQRQPTQLDPWLTRAATSALAPFRRFAKGLREDYAAVKAGVTLPWSQGPIEGHINRLKLLKRQMFGRARLDLLSRRFLLAPRGASRSEPRPQAPVETPPAAA